MNYTHAYLHIMLRFQCQQEMRKQFSTRESRCCCCVIVQSYRKPSLLHAAYKRPGRASVACLPESIAIAFVSRQPDQRILQFPHPDRSRNTPQISRENIEEGCHPALHTKLNHNGATPNRPNPHRVEGNSSVLPYSAFSRAPSNNEEHLQFPMYTPTRRLANQLLKTRQTGKENNRPEPTFIHDSAARDSETKMHQRERIGEVIGEKIISVS